jgi:hypothetical protein
MSNEMTDTEFDKLKHDLALAIGALEELQQIYRKQTGKRFVPPLRPAPSFVLTDPTTQGTIEVNSRRRIFLNGEWK